MTLSLTVEVSLNYRFHNKNALGRRKSAYADFTRRAVTLQELADHILSGKTWAPGVFTQGRSKEAFGQAELLALDLDNNVSVEQALAHPFVQQHAFFVHPSPSSTPEQPRTRVLFRLSEPVTSVDRFETLVLGIVDECAELQPDKACTDAARMFHGSDVPGAYANYDAVLPLSVAGELTRPHAETEMGADFAFRNQPRIARAEGDGAELSTALVAEVERELNVAGAPRNTRGFTATAISCPFKKHEHDDISPAAYWSFDTHILYCHKCGQSYLTVDVARALGVHLATPYKPHPVFDRLHTGKQTVEINRQHIRVDDLASLCEPGKTLLVKSPMNTGKTEAMVQLAARHKRVLVIVHRRWLARNATDRLNAHANRAGAEFVDYRDVSEAQLPDESRLVICINSLPKLAAFGRALPTYDLVVIDEVEQVLGSLTGDTFQGAEAVTVLHLLTHVLRQADSVLAMDAYATSLSWDYLCGTRDRKRATFLTNTFQLEHRPMRVHSKAVHVIEQVNVALPDSKKLIVIATDSLRLAKALYAYYSGEMPIGHEDLNDILLDDGQNLAEMLKGGFFDTVGLGKDQVAIIHGENSDQKQTLDLIRHINQQSQLRLLIYNSALGSGVDIQIPVEAVFGIFTGIVPADEIMQMLGRCRNVARFEVFVRSHSHYDDPNIKHLYKREREAAIKTGKLLHKIELGLHFDPHNRRTWEPSQQQFLRLWARVTAKGNHSRNQLKAHFLLLAAEQFTIEQRSSDATEEQRQIVANTHTIGRALREVDKHRVLTVSPVNDYTYHEHLFAGSATPEIHTGYIRWIIESVYRQPITSGIYDHWCDGGAEKLTLYRMVVGPGAQALREDWKQDAADFALPNRNHFYHQRRLLRAMLKDVFGAVHGFHEIQPLTKAEIDERMWRYAEQHGADLRRFMGERPDYSKAPINVLRYMLRRVGLKLDRARSRKTGTAFTIASDSIRVMECYRHHLETVEAMGVPKSG